MRFSVITPSFRSNDWLKLNIPSVADQGVEHEHIVQDSCSDDGTLDWLPTDSRVQAFIEKDKGMYDAVNRGLRRATGDICSYLNCDEQYLPGALKKVGAVFAADPDVDIVFADTVLHDPAGEYLCHRIAVTPTEGHTLVGGNLAILTAATFFRRRILEQGYYFSDTLRDLGDADWILRVVRGKLKMAILPEMTSTFADTGENMNLKPNARREAQELFDSAPPRMKLMRPAILVKYRLRKLFRGGYTKAPFAYEIYTKASPEKRVSIRAEKPTGQYTRWIPPMGNQWKS